MLDRGLIPQEFNEWFEENKESESLLDDYANYKQNCGNALTFKEWAREYFKSTFSI